MEVNIGGKIVEISDEERTRCEVWSRVMGYYRPVENWNVGKRQEFEDRVNFIIPKEIKNEL